MRDFNLDFCTRTWFYQCFVSPNWRVQFIEMRCFWNFGLNIKLLRGMNYFERELFLFTNSSRPNSCNSSIFLVDLTSSRWRVLHRKLLRVNILFEARVMPRCWKKWTYQTFRMWPTVVHLSNLWSRTCWQTNELLSYLRNLRSLWKIATLLYRLKSLLLYSVMNTALNYFHITLELINRRKLVIIFSWILVCKKKFSG